MPGYWRYRKRYALRRWWVAVIVLYALAGDANAQFRDNFESPDPTWKLAGADCSLRSLSHKRTFEQAHGGSSSEHLRFVAGQGTRIYYALDIGRSPIIDESSFSVWMKSDRARLQLLVRVVLPRTIDETTGKPITRYLLGGEYGEIGSWQQLQVKDLPKKLDWETIVLRRELTGKKVDPREAYVDLVVLNVYGGPGESNVWLDDLEVQGVIDPDWASRTGRDDADTIVGPSRSATSIRPAVVDGNVLIVENRPTLVRAIEHQGESLEVFKALGFNAVYLTTTPTSELNEQAKRFELWLIAPPPDLAADPAAAARLDRVITWQIGTQLRGEQVAQTRSLATELRAADRALARPLMCSVAGDAWTYSREAELLLWHMPYLFSSSTMAAGSAGLKARASQARVGSPYWAVVEPDSSRALLDQLALFDRAAPRHLPIDLQQARSATLEALASGARGLIFRSPAPLDADDEATQQRAAVLRLVNLELNLIEPWFAGGSPPQDLPTGDASLRATLLHTERSRLVLLARDQPRGQFVPPPVVNDTMLLAMPGVPVSDRLYHLTTDGLRSLDGPVGGSGAKIVVPEAGHIALVAITQDPLVIQHLSRTSEAQRREGVEVRLRLAANRLTSTALVGEEIRGLLPPPRDAIPALREAQRTLQEADQLLLRRDFTGCYRNTRRVENLVAQARRQWWDAVQNSFPSPLSSPCCVCFDTLPSHARLAIRLQNAAWSRNGLPGGDCEQLDRLLAAGWKQQRSDPSRVTTQVELSENGPHSGARSLRLLASPAGNRETVLEEPAVTITTAPILARQGQIARIHGFVRVPQPLQGGGLTVYDNFGGPELAELVSHAPDWKEFILYRAVPSDGELRVSFALQGFGEAFVDDVTVEFTTAAAE